GQRLARIVSRCQPQQDWQYIARDSVQTRNEMTLEESFGAICPCIVGFISKLRGTRVGERPLFPLILGTGFLVDSCGLAVTNRHVIECFDRIPCNPKTGEFPVAAFLFLPGDEGKSVQFLALELKKWVSLQSFGSDKWYGQATPD